MPYLLDTDLINLLDDPYCSFNDFKKFVRKLRQCKCWFVEDRRAIRAAINELEKGAPFSETCRFPDEYYIHLVGNFQINILSPLRLLIDQSDALTHNTQLVDMAKTFRNIIINFQNICDLRNVPDLLKHNIFDRSSFEEKYGLIWLDDCMDDVEEHEQKIIPFQ